MADLFAHKAAGYDQRSTPVQISEGVAGLLDSRLGLDPDQEVLDFGAGTGLLCGHVAPRVKEVLAVDVSESMLAALRAKPELEGRVRTLCRNILEDPLDRRFDRVVSAMVMHHVEDTRAMLATLSEHLRPGGRLAIADLDAEDGNFHEPGTEGVFHAGFDRDALGRLLVEIGFEEIAFDTVCRVERHGGTYPIFLVTATRPA